MRTLRVFAVISLLLLATMSIVAVSSLGAAPHSSPSISSLIEGRSVILMIGDGMGYSHIELAGLVEYGESGSLVLETLPWSASVITDNIYGEITDSAAAATAIATGNKTSYGMIAMNPDKVSLQTILEIAQTGNKSAGLVSTCRVNHATPAPFMTHVDSRHQYTEITRQIVEEAGVDVLLGGGSYYFSQDYLDAMESIGYSLVFNRTALLNVTSGKVLGLFAMYDMVAEISRDYLTIPSLLEMTNKSIELLSQNPKGFFLMVEGGQIDYAGHENNKVGVALETIEFDKAVSLALSYVEANNDTILIVTADHETGGLTVVGHNLDERLPSSLSTESEQRSLRVERATNVTVTWASDDHTYTYVPMFAYGAAFDELGSNMLIDNTNIFDFMFDFYAGDPLTAVNITPAVTTTETSTTTATETTGTDTTTTTGVPLDANMIVLVSVGLGILAVVIVVVVLKRR